MPFELFLALRFLREGRAQSALILLGAAVGVAVIVFLSALIDGLQASLIEQTLGSQAHLVVRAPDEEARRLSPAGEPIAARVERAPQRLQTIAQWRPLVETLEAFPGVLAACPTVTGAAFAIRGPASRSVVLRGLDPDRFQRVIDVRRRLVQGTYRLSGRDTLIGKELARDLGATLGDSLRIETPEGRADVFTIAGIFDFGNEEVNSRWVLVPLRPSQTLLDLAGGVSAVELKVADVFEADAISHRIAARTGLVADSWMKLNAQLLTALRSQSSSRTLIQLFVVIAVTLGIASVLIVSVIQKSREIGILRAMGTSTGQITRVFLAQGAIVGLAGAIAGCALGSGLALSFARLATGPDGSPLFPVALTPALFLWAPAISLATGLLAAAGPARRAARLDPAEVIRNG